jgi:hypothetical protein
MGAKFAWLRPTTRKKKFKKVKKNFKKCRFFDFSGMESLLWRPQVGGQYYGGW